MRHASSSPHIISEPYRRERIVESPEAAKVAVMKKMGLGFLYWELLKSDVKNGIFKTISIPDLNLKFTTFILYRRDRPLSADAQNFLALLRQRRRKSQIPELSVQTAENLPA